MKIPAALQFSLGENKEMVVNRPNNNTIESDSEDEEKYQEEQPKFSPFWNNDSFEMIQQLWLPTEEKEQDVIFNQLNGFSRNEKHDSYEIIKPQSTFSRFEKPTLFSEPDIEIHKDIKSCRKIRIYPSTETKLLLDKCFDATRYMQNKALELLEQNPNVSKSHISLRNLVSLRDRDIRNNNNPRENWLIKVPYDTRDLALKQLSQDFKSNFELLKHGHINHFEMRFRSKKKDKQTCFVNKKALNLKTMKLFPTRTKEPLKLRKKMKRWISNSLKEVEGQFCITREKNRYYMCLPVVKQNEYQTEYEDMTILDFQQPYNCVALDPGVRTFQTFYSDQNIAGKIGDNMCERLIDVGLKEDRLKSFLQRNKNSLSKRTKYNLKKRCSLLRAKIKNITNDLHWKTANYLCSNFQHILIPKFEVSKMVRKDLPYRARKISSKSVRNMLSLSHFKFRKRLEYLGTVKGCKVEVVGEEFTTKGCGGCGRLDYGIGSKKWYDCDFCPFEMDRDYNAARNILLKCWFERRIRAFHGLDTTR